MEFRYVHFNSIPDNEILVGIIQLHNLIFRDSDDLVKKMKSKSNLSIGVALERKKVIGYKIGYELSHDKFYSWLGGVDPDYRNYGIATKLMKMQHDYLKGNGYKTVQTKTMNKWRNMLIMNIKSGFDIIGIYTDEHGEAKIILEKKL